MVGNVYIAIRLEAISLSTMGHINSVRPTTAIRPFGAHSTEPCGRVQAGWPIPNFIQAQTA